MNDFYEGRMIPLKIADMAIINCNKEIEKLQIENARLKAEVERLTKAIEGSSYYFMSIKLNVENARLQAEVERLTNLQSGADYFKAKEDKPSV